MTQVSVTPEEATPPPAEASLHKQVLRGSAWILVGYGLSQLIRAGSNLVMVRLLTPDAFGVMALVNVFLQGLQMFSDIGIRASIIQSKRGDDPAFLNTAWTMSCLRGVILWIIACAAAMPYAWFYHTPALATLIPVTGLTALLSGFNSTALATSNRKLALGKLTLLETVAQAISVGIVILWARFVSPTAWALVAGGVGNSIVYLALGYLWLPGIRHRFMWDREAARSLTKFGRWVFLSTAITFLAVQCDALVLGKLLASTAVTTAAAATALGIYNNGKMWGQLPSQVFQQIVGRVFFPAIARMMHAGTFEPEMVNRMRVRLLLPVALGSAALFVVAKPAIQLVYPVNYHGAGEILGIVALGMWVGTICHTYGNVLLAAGQSKYISFATASKLILFLALAWPAFQQWDIRGIAIAVGASELGGLIPMLIGARTIGVAIPGREFLLTLAGAAFGAVLWVLQDLILKHTGSILADVIILGTITATACGLCVRSLLTYLRRVV